MAVAVEAISLVQLEGIGLRAAVGRASTQMHVEEGARLRQARRLAQETMKRKNVLDTVLGEALEPAELGDFRLGVQAFLRIFVYETRMSPYRMKPIHLSQLGRRILGWEELLPVEQALGRIASINMGDHRGSFGDDEDVSLRTFHPLWFVRYSIRNFGRVDALRLLSASYSKNRVLVRLNRLRSEECEVLSELESRDVDLKPLEGLPLLYEVRADKGIRKEIKAGLLQLQDLPSALAVVASTPGTGKNVLFANASPASAASYMAQLMANTGSVSVLDESEERLSRVSENASRVQASIVSAKLMKNSDRVSDRNFDTVMLHAPNSRTGLFWREPSLKWRTQPSMIRHFADLQDGLFDVFTQMVKAGGNMIYWTRSVAVEENELAVEKFLRRCPDLVLSDITSKIGIPGLRGQYQTQRLFPHLHYCDGAFVACLTRLE